ncbi:hypothetical protein [Frankia sp. AgW1.1]|uniref:hypothetical protein n=1 Tax=Frankia sp. AgW1.1 TaxID=1836971 RepID=UPI0019342A28|nr:hypothetical protein [Frankia sp. AgW1.1]MBL7487122.1 hypothetical protein [Frankia sp. AgW1.1]
MTTDDLMRRISDLVDEAIEDDPEAALQDPDDDGWEYRETAMRWSAERTKAEDDSRCLCGAPVPCPCGEGAGVPEWISAAYEGYQQRQADYFTASIEPHARLLADQIAAQMRSTFGEPAHLSFQSTNPSPPYQHWIRGRLDVQWDAGSRASEMVASLLGDSFRPILDRSPVPVGDYLDVDMVRRTFEDYRPPMWEPEFWRRAPDVLPSPLTAPTVTSWDVPTFDLPAHWEMFDGHNWSTIAVPVTDIRWTSPTGPDLPQIHRVDLGEVRREQLTAALSSVLGPGAQITDWLSPRARADLMPPLVPDFDPDLMVDRRAAQVRRALSGEVIRP